MSWFRRLDETIMTMADISQAPYEPLPCSSRVLCHLILAEVSVIVVPL